APTSLGRRALRFSRRPFPSLPRRRSLSPQTGRHVMQRRFIYTAMIILGLTALTAGVFGQQEPPVAPQDCKIVKYCTPVPAQAAQRDKERKPVVVGGTELTARGQDVNVGGEGDNGDPGLMWRETWKLAPTTQPIDD